MNKKMNWLILLAASATALSVSGCSSNPSQPESAADAGDTQALNVSSTDDGCEVSASSAKSGNVTFNIKNDGS